MQHLGNQVSDGFVGTALRTVFPEEFLNAVKMDINGLRSLTKTLSSTKTCPAASNAGIPMISMNINRAFVDVNRDKIEIDPAFFNHPQKDLPMGRR